MKIIISSIFLYTISMFWCALVWWHEADLDYSDPHFIRTARCEYALAVVFCIGTIFGLCALCALPVRHSFSGGGCGKNSEPSTTQPKANHS